MSLPSPMLLVLMLLLLPPQKASDSQVARVALEGEEEQTGGAAV